MTLALQYVVEGRPMTWQRAGKNAAGKISFYARKSTDKRSGSAIAEYKRRVATLALAARPANWPTDAAYIVEIASYYPDRRFGDSDRLPGLIFDAMQNGIAYMSDRQIGGHVCAPRRVDKARPRVEVTVVPYDESADDVAIDVVITRREGSDEERGLRKARGAARAKGGKRDGGRRDGSGRNAVATDGGDASARADRHGARGRGEGDRGEDRRGALCAVDRAAGVESDDAFIATDDVIHGEVAR